MALIVGSDDARRRLTNGEGKRDLIYGIPETATKNRQVHLVVRRGAGNEGEQASQRNAQKIAKHPRPISRREEQRKHDEKQRPKIRPMAEQGQDFRGFHGGDNTRGSRLWKPGKQTKSLFDRIG